jgi:hypothetical protein
MFCARSQRVHEIEVELTFPLFGSEEEDEHVFTLFYCDIQGGDREFAEKEWGKRTGKYQASQRVSISRRSQVLELCQKAIRVTDM